VDVWNKRADEFLRHAEPPSHDYWWPPASGAAPTTNLRNNYDRGYLVALNGIRKQVLEALNDLFVAAPPPSPEGPRAVTRHLQFLSRRPGPPPPPAAKPILTLESGHVDSSGAWCVTVSADMANRPEGWSFEPRLVFVGDAHETLPVAATVSAVSGCSASDGVVRVSPVERRRRLAATFTLTSDPAGHPIPASASSVEVEVRNPGPAEVRS
jgi:hypothetical protein